MRVLVACEFSGIVRDAFRARGHDAWSCDIMPTEKPGPHIVNDVRNVLDWGWDLMIAHPPCTYLANSGVRWLKERPERWALMYMAADFMRQLWEAPISHVAIENPVQHRYAKIRHGLKIGQIIQPYDFGENETKATCLWLRDVPPLMATMVTDGRVARVHLEPPGPDRWKNRSRTYEGIASAMAEQWGNL